MGINDNGRADMKIMEEAQTLNQLNQRLYLLEECFRRLDDCLAHTQYEVEALRNHIADLLGVDEEDFHLSIYRTAEHQFNQNRADYEQLPIVTPKDAASADSIEELQALLDEQDRQMKEHLEQKVISSKINDTKRKKLPPFELLEMRV